MDNSRFHHWWFANQTDKAIGRPLPETHLSFGDAALDHLLSFDAPGFAMLCTVSLLFNANAVFCIYDCKGPLVAGCVAHARVQHTQCVLISCITNDRGSGFQIKGHKGFLDLTVLHIRKKTNQNSKVWTIKTLTTKCFKTIIIKRLFYFWLSYSVNISNNSSWHASPHPCLTRNQTIKQL